MRLFGLNITRATNPLPSGPRAAVPGAGVVISTPDQLADAIRSEASETLSGQTVTAETAMRTAAVNGSVRILTGTVANMPLALKRRVDDRTRVSENDHPLALVLRRRPNRWMTPSGFRRLMQAHVLLRGNAYALIVRSPRNNQITDLVPLHPDRTRPEQFDDRTIVYRHRRKSGEETVIPERDMFHLIGMTFDGVTGLSVIGYARQTIGLALATEEHGAKVFKDGTSIGAVLKHPGKIGQEGKDNLRESLEAYRGSANAHQNLILEEGMEYEPIGMNNEDAQFIETRQFSRSDIAMFFGVPPHMLGDTTKTTSWGSGIEQQSLGYVAYTAEDWLTGWEETINRDLIADPASDLFARFNRASLVRGDIKTRYTAYSIGLQNGFLCPNDVREAEDMNPIEGGDTYRAPLNMEDINATFEETGDEPPRSA